MTNFLLSTGVGQRSLIYLKIKDVDFNNNPVFVSATKDRKSLIVPLNHAMVNSLSKYLKCRI